jgi:5,10-methylene-tetrahydrofolate dehydrogenase/methenyl tetrahydrofolate cyclohydrolase
MLMQKVSTRQPQQIFLSQRRLERAWSINSNVRNWSRLSMIVCSLSLSKNRDDSEDSSTRKNATSTSRIVDVTDLADKMRQKVRAYVKSRAGTEIRMVGIIANAATDPNDCSSSLRRVEDAETYSQTIQTKFHEDGLHYEVHRCSGDSPEAVEAAIHRMNYARPDVHGILVFYPIFQQRTARYNRPASSSTGSESKDISSYYLNTATGVHYRKAAPPYYLNPDTGVYYKTVDDYLRDRVISSKDVEGLCRDSKSIWHFRARGGRNRSPNEVYIPCTVTAVLKILETYHLRLDVDGEGHSGTDLTLLHPLIISSNDQQQRWAGIVVTIINRSSILGRPLAALLALAGATVYSVDERSIIQFQSGGRMRRCSKDLALHDCLQRSSVVVTAVPGDTFELDCDAIADFTTVVDVSEQSNVDADRLLRQREGISLISSVGKVTVAALEHNLIRLHNMAVHDECTPW